MDAIVATALLGIALAVIDLPHRTATTAGRAQEKLAPVEAEENVLVGAGR
jgi:hypothetical protein